MNLPRDPGLRVVEALARAGIRLPDEDVAFLAAILPILDQAAACVREGLEPAWDGDGLA